MSKFVKNPDEIVLEDVKMVHYEVMEPGKSVWLGIYLNDGRMYHLNIGGNNLWVNYSDESGPITTIDKDALALEIAKEGIVEYNEALKTLAEND
jgi:hypothetical protein